MEKIILASNSPRRKEFIALLGLEFEVITKDIEEIIDQNILPEDLVEDLAFQKAYAVFQDHKDRVVIGFDTLVYTDTQILGKPRDEEDAIRMLMCLSGKTHYVVTGVSILAKKMSRTFHSKTKVTFYPMTQKEIEEYVNTKEPLDKAGAYGAQGYGSKFIKEMDGDFFTVVGLPLSKLYQELKALEIIT